MIATGRTLNKPPVCGYAGHVARKMSSRSQLSHRTYGGSPNWLLDHHQPVLCVLHNCSSRQYRRVLAAFNGADGNACFQENPSLALLFDRRLWQQNRHKADIPRCLVFVRFRGPKSKPPGEIALDRMVVRTVGELARIGDAELGLRGELQIAAASTSAASRAIGTPKVLNPEPMLWNESAAVGVTSPKACCQATDARAMSAMPFCRR